MPQTNKKIALTAVILINLIFFPANKSLSDPKTWDNSVERKNLFFEKFNNSPFSGKIEIYWPNGHLKETGVIKDGKKDNLWEYYHKNGKPRVTPIICGSVLTIPKLKPE